MSNDEHRDEFDAFFRQHKEPLAGYLRSLGVAPETVAKVINEAFRVVRKQWARLRTSHPKPYLFTVARNLAYKQARRGELPTSRIGIDDASADVAASPSEVDRFMDLLANRERLNVLLECLPPRQREALTLRYLKSFSVKETAEIMKVTVGTVKRHTFDGLKRLRELVGRSGDGIAQEVRER